MLSIQNSQTILSDCIVSTVKKLAIKFKTLWLVFLISFFFTESIDFAYVAITSMTYWYMKVIIHPL